MRLSLHVALLGGLLAGCGPAVTQVDFPACFGPQDVDREVHSGKLGFYDIDVRVVDGARVRIEESRNPTITCVDGAIVQRIPARKPGRMYVYAKLKLNAERGWRIYDCMVRVRTGALKGAIITVCVDLPPSIVDAYQACYQLPEGARVEEGPLDCEVVRFWGK